MISSAKVEFITSQETLDLRSRILRPGQPIENCNYACDNENTSLHLGIRQNDRVVCNGTFLQEAHKNWPQARKPYRLRGMATETEFQKQGLGKMLIEFALDELSRRDCDLLWFNARTSALGFYEKLGFTAVGGEFDIPGVGPHRVMSRLLVF